MEKADAGGKGMVVLATVKGDVHDIGKNLVDIILTNNGYIVYNLGIKIAINEMIEKALEVKADAIGMSGLLVKSTIIMRENLEELNTRGLSDTRAGAPRRRRADAQLRGARPARGLRRPRLLRQGRVRGPAHDGHAHGRARKNGTLDPDVRTRARRAPAAAPQVASTTGRATSRSRRAPTSRPTRTIFTPPFVGSRVAKGISLDDIAGYVNETALFRNQWQFRPESGENDEDFKARIRPTLRAQLGIAKQEGLLVPAAAWGYFAVNSEGDDLVVWKDDTRTQEWLRFSLPRQRKAPFLCIADFFRPVESGETDYAAFHVVTMGTAASASARRSCSRPTSTRTTCCCTASRSR